MLRNKDSIIAAAVTFGVVLLLLLLLFFGSMRFDRNLLAQSSTPEVMMLADDDEQFIEPEIVEDLGEQDALTHDEPAPAMKGQPEKSDTENSKLVVPGKNSKPAPPVEKPVTQKKENPVKAQEPPKTDEKKQKVTSKMAGKFPGQNGAENGRTGQSGAGGTGMGISGSVSGRTFKGCPKPSVELQNQVVVEVKVTINAAGHVTAATARSRRGKASQTILRACEQAARGARWNEDPGTPAAHGSITFTITPR